MNGAVQDGVAQCWVADDGVPLIDRHLAGHYGGGATVRSSWVWRSSRRSDGLSTDMPRSSSTSSSRLMVLRRP